MMNNTVFADKLKEIASKHKTLYVKGCFGAPLTGDNVSRYCNNYDFNKEPSRTALIRANADKNPPVYGFDCVCLLKGVLWGWDADANDTYGGAKYESNGVPDIAEDEMITRCSDLSEDFTDIEIGEAVWIPGHIGVYVGDGKCVECTTKWTDNVQFSNLGNKAEYKTGNYRVWDKHGKLPYVTYVKESNTVAVGDIVDFTGTKHYVSSDGGEGSACKSGKAKVTIISPSAKHPYHLIGVEGGTSNVYGWVDASDIAQLSGKTDDSDWIPAVGDKVIYKGNVHYPSSDAPESSAISCKGGPASITIVYEPESAKHPYHLVREEGSGATVYGWVDAGSFVKA